MIARTLKTHIKFTVAHTGVIATPFLYTPAHTLSYLYAPFVSVLTYPVCATLASIGGLASYIETQSRLHRDRMADALAQAVARKFNSMLRAVHHSIDPSGIQAGADVILQSLQTQETAREILIDVQMSLAQDSIPDEWQGLAVEAMVQLEKVQSIQNISEEVLSTIHDILCSIAQLESNWTEIPSDELGRVLRTTVIEKSDPFLDAAIRYASITKKVAYGLLILVYAFLSIVPAAALFLA